MLSLNFPLLVDLLLRTADLPRDVRTGHFFALADELVRVARARGRCRWVLDIVGPRRCVDERRKQRAAYESAKRRFIRAHDFPFSSVLWRRHSVVATRRLIDSQRLNHRA